MNNCPHKGNCESEGIRCSTCIHNPDRKEDYYQREKENWTHPYCPYPDWHCESINQCVPRSKTIVLDLCRIE